MHVNTSTVVSLDSLPLSPEHRKLVEEIERLQYKRHRQRPRPLPTNEEEFLQRHAGPTRQLGKITEAEWSRRVESIEDPTVRWHVANIIAWDYVFDLPKQHGLFRKYVYSKYPEVEVKETALVDALVSCGYPFYTAAYRIPNFASYTTPIGYANPCSLRTKRTQESMQAHQMQVFYEIMQGLHY